VYGLIPLLAAGLAAFSGLLVLSAALVPAPATAGVSAPSLRPDMPREIRSWRDDWLSGPQYLDLADQWRTYSITHPEAAVAHVMIYRALYYAGGQDVEEIQAHITRALEIDPDCPEALNAKADTVLRSGTPLVERAESYELASRAVELAPQWARPHFVLYPLAVLLDKPREAAQHLAALLDKGAFTTPLIDHAHNLLVSAEPDGFVFTNGDNDTYPCLALQQARGIRPDVTVVNLSLLNLPEFARLTVGPEHPDGRGPFTNEELNGMYDQFQREYVQNRRLFSSLVMRELCARAADGRHPGPVYVAVTVPTSTRDQCGKEVRIEGLLLRAGTRDSESTPEPIINLERTYQLFTRHYRLESATDLGTRWSDYPSVAHLMGNYSGILFRLAVSAAKADRAPEMRYAFRTGLIIDKFHGNSESRDRLTEYWNRLDPDNTEARSWLSKPQ